MYQQQTFRLNHEEPKSRGNAKSQRDAEKGCSTQGMRASEGDEGEGGRSCVRDSGCAEEPKQEKRKGRYTQIQEPHLPKPPADSRSKQQTPTRKAKDIFQSRCGCEVFLPQSFKEDSCSALEFLTHQKYLAKFEKKQRLFGKQKFHLSPEGLYGKENTKGSSKCTECSPARKKTSKDSSRKRRIVTDKRVEMQEETKSKTKVTE